MNEAIDYTKLSDDELNNIINSSKDNKKIDYTKLSDDELNDIVNSSKKNRENLTLSDVLKKYLIHSSLNTLENIGTGILGKGEFRQGLSESVPRTLAGAVSGLSQALGYETGIKLPKESQSSSPLRSLGRISGELGSLGALSAPLSYEAAAILPKVIPYALRHASGAGVAGGLLSEGDLKERLKEAGLWSATSLGLQGSHKLLGSLTDSIKNIYKGVKDIPSKIRQPKNIQTELSDYENELEKYKNEKEISDTESELSKHSLDSIKSLLAERFGSASPESLARKIHESKQKITELEPFSKRPQQQIENVLPSATGENLIPEAKAQLESRQAHENKLTEDLSKTFGKGEEHRINLARRVNPVIEAKQNEIGSEYDAIENRAKQNNIEVPKSRNYESIVSDINNLINDENIDSPEIIKIAEELKTSGKNNLIPADELLSRYRTLRRIGQETRHSSYGKNEDERRRLINLSEKISGVVDNIGEYLEDYLPDLRKVNARYKNEIAPLFKSNFYHAILKGEAPSDMIRQLGKEPHIKKSNPNKVTGTKILNEIIQNDPESIRLLLGERYSEHPERIHNWNQGTERYLNLHPEIQELAEQHRASQYETQNARTQLDEATQKKSDLDIESKRVNKSYEISKKEELERRESHKEISRLSDEIRDQEDALKKLNDESKKHTNNLKEKINIGKKISKKQESIKKLKSDLKHAKSVRDKLVRKSAIIGTSLLGTGIVTSKIRKLLQ